MLASTILCLVLLTQTISEHRLPLIIGPEPTQTWIVPESAARQVYKRLFVKRLRREPLVDSERKLLPAIEAALGSIPNRCDEGQVAAGLCLVGGNQ